MALQDYFDQEAFSGSVGTVNVGGGGEETFSGSNVTGQTANDYGSGTFAGNLLSVDSLKAGLVGLAAGGPAGAVTGAVLKALDTTYGISDQVKNSIKSSFNKAISGGVLSDQDAKNISIARNLGDGQYAETVDGIMRQNYGNDDAILSSYTNTSNAISQSPGGVTGYLKDAGSMGGNVEASWQQKAVDYLIERDEIPNQFRDEALKRLGGLSGLEGGIGSQEDLIGRAKESPLYTEIMGGQKAGEEAILRNASATGGLRSGNTQSNFMDFNTNLQNQALLTSYNQQLQGLTGLAGLSGDTTAIAQGMSNVGTSLQSGINRNQEIGFERDYASQARADQLKRDERNNWLGVASLGLELFSDKRLKKNIKKLGRINGFNWYSWDWNSIAEKFGLKGSSQGVIADEILKINPKAVSIRNLFMTVDYSKLGILGVQNAK